MSSENASKNTSEYISVAATAVVSAAAIGQNDATSQAVMAPAHSRTRASAFQRVFHTVNTTRFAYWMTFLGGGVAFIGTDLLAIGYLIVAVPVVVLAAIRARRG